MKLKIEHYCKSLLYGLICRETPERSSMNIRCLVSPGKGQINPKGLKTRSERIDHCDTVMRQFTAEFKIRFPKYRIIKTFHTIMSLLVELPAGDFEYLGVAARETLDGATVERANNKSYPS